MKKGTEAVVARIPLCDLCNVSIADSQPAVYDAKMPSGPWANLCQRHFDVMGCSLGTGRGQRFVLAGEKRSMTRETFYALYPRAWGGDEPEPEATPDEQAPSSDAPSEHEALVEFFSRPIQAARDEHAAFVAERPCSLDPDGYCIVHDSFEHLPGSQANPVPLAEAVTSHAEYPKGAYAVGPLCSASTGYTVPNESSVTCSACKGILGAEQMLGQGF